MGQGTLTEEILHNVLSSRNEDQHEKVAVSNGEAIREERYLVIKDQPMLQQSLKFCC
jgi:hypothetical protein